MSSIEEFNFFTLPRFKLATMSLAISEVLNTSSSAITSKYRLGTSSNSPAAFSLDIGFLKTAGSFPAT